MTMRVSEATVGIASAVVSREALSDYAGTSTAEASADSKSSSETVPEKQPATVQPRRRRSRTAAAASRVEATDTGAADGPPGVIRVVPEGFTGKQQRQAPDGPISRDELEQAIRLKTIYSVPVTHITDNEVFVLLKSDEVSGHLFGVMPYSEFDDKLYAGYEGFVGETVDVIITGFDAVRGMASVSRRQARAIKRQQLLDSGFGLGSVVLGVVRSIQPYAAFVDVGGLHCILPVNEISHSYVNHPGDVLKRGDEVLVKVVSWNPETLKCRVSIKALHDPWAKVSGLYAKGNVVDGHITGVRDGHVWVRPQPYHGVEILCAAMEGRRYDIGREVRVRLTTVAPEQQKLRGKIIAFVR